jgi:hypothetical protein
MDKTVQDCLHQLAERLQATANFAEVLEAQLPPGVDSELVQKVARHLREACASYKELSRMLADRPAQDEYQHTLSLHRHGV